MLEFKQEMLIPKINGKIYYAIYELENWLRRICLTVYMQSFGENWTLEIPSGLSKKLKETEAKNLKFSYLEADNDKNIIWVATLAELVELLRNDKIKDQLEFFINIERENFFDKIKELRQIRNFLAHNRALTKSTEIIVNGIIESLGISIRNFKSHILYNKNNASHDFVFPEFDNENNEVIEDKDEVIRYFFYKAKNTDYSNYQPVIAKGKFLYSLLSLPVPRNNNYPSAYKLLNQYSIYIDLIIALLINKDGDEYSILISNQANKEIVKGIIDLFLGNDLIWTSKTFEEQNPKYVCNPKIWFYENREIINE